MVTDSISFIFIFVIIVLSATIHEFSHGFIAYALGDPTAKYQGRLTLNPLAHMDIFGTVILPAISILFFGFFFGAAKPIPYNPYNLKNQKWGPFMVGIAGPASNLIVAIIFGFILRAFVGTSLYGGMFFSGMISIIVVNVYLTIFNLIPVPPLDGSKIIPALLPYDLAQKFHQMEGRMAIFGIIIALMVAPYILSSLADLLFSLIIPNVVF